MTILGSLGIPGGNYFMSLATLSEVEAVRSIHLLLHDRDILNFGIFTEGGFN